MRRSGAVPIPQGDAGAEVPDTATNMDFLDLGTTVASVSDDQRRVVFADIEKAELQIATIKTAVATEKTCEHELAKQKGSAAKENAALFRSANQLADNLTMNAQMLQSAEKTLSNEIHDLLIKSDDSTERKPDSENPSAATTQPLNQSRQKALALQGSFHNHLSSARAGFRDFKLSCQREMDLEAEVSALESTIKVSQKELEAQEVLRQEKLTILEKEKARLASLKATKETSKKNAAAAAKRVDNLVRGPLPSCLTATCSSTDSHSLFCLCIPQKAEIAAAKEAHAAAIAAKKKEIAEKDAQVAGTREKLSSIAAATAIANAHKETIDTYVGEYKNLKNERDGHMRALQQVRAERNALFIAKEDIGKKLASIKKSIEAQQKLIHDLETQLHEVIDPLKAANAMMDSEKVAKEREYAELLSNLEKHCAIVSKGDVCDEKAAAEEEAKVMQQRKLEMECKLETLKEEFKEAEAALTEVQQEKEKYDLVLARIKTASDDLAALQDEIRSLTEGRAKSDALIEAIRMYEIYKDGAIMIKKAKKIESDLDKGVSMQSEQTKERHNEP
jgi:hypothetical protein